MELPTRRHFLKVAVRPEPRTPPEPRKPAVTGAEATAAALGRGDKVELVFVGDVMLSRNIAKTVEARGADFTFPFMLAAPYVRRADVAFCNLECPISGRGEKIEKRYTFNAPAKSIEGLEFAGFDVVSLANNHVLDYGVAALDDTTAHLRSASIEHVGLSTKGQPQTPIVKQVRGLTIGYLAYTDPRTPYAHAKEYDKLGFDTNPAKATFDQCKADIAALKQKVDIVAVSMHWGIEYKLKPGPLQRELGRFLIDQGVHIVAGHHPHVQQDPEWYKGGVIIYSMGNFVFDQWSRPPTRIGRLYRVLAGKEGISSLEYLPLAIERKTGYVTTPTANAFVRVASG